MRFLRAANSRLTPKLQRASNRAQSTLSRSLLSQPEAQIIKNQERAFGVPLVIEQEMGGERTYDIYSRLLKDRIICVFGQERIQNSNFFYSKSNDFYFELGNRFTTSWQPRSSPSFYSWPRTSRTSPLKCTLIRQAE